MHLTASDSAIQQRIIDNAYHQISSIKKIIENGDIITRTGNDFTSRGLMTLNRRDETYSHCGIASIENDTVFVYHALGGEWNPDEKLRRDPLHIFTDPTSNTGIGVFRFDIPRSTKVNIVGVTKDFYTKEIMFDMDFDLNTNNRMYCTEFVYKTLVKASDATLAFNHSLIKDFEFIGVDDIFLHPLCKMQQQVVYK